MGAARRPPLRSKCSGAARRPKTRAFQARVVTEQRFGTTNAGRHIWRHKSPRLLMPRSSTYTHQVVVLRERLDLCGGWVDASARNARSRRKMVAQRHR